MIEGVKQESAKRVSTFDAKGKENGFLTEMFKDGEKTMVYLSSTAAGGFKGYHLHRVRAARYMCLKGKMKIILWKPGTKQRGEYILDAAQPTRLYIPPRIATGLQNIGNEEAWLVNFPDPAYDPALKDEQIEYNEEELNAGVVK